MQLTTPAKKLDNKEAFEQFKELGRTAVTKTSREELPPIVTKMVNLTSLVSPEDLESVRLLVIVLRKFCLADYFYDTIKANPDLKVPSCKCKCNCVSTYRQNIKAERYNSIQEVFGALLDTFA